MRCFMTHLLMKNSYELSRLESAIEKISGILVKYADHPHAYEYYTAIQECLLALQGALDAAEAIDSRQQKIEDDVACLKHLFLKHIKEKKP